MLTNTIKVRLVIACGVLLFASACPSPSVPCGNPPCSTQDGPRCGIGLEAKVYEDCACHPFEQRLEGRTMPVQLDEDLRARVHRCMNGKLGEIVSKADLGKMDARGCITSESPLDEDTKQLLMREVEGSKADTTDDDLRTFNACRSRALGQAPRSSP
jgi:hypothetical protein